MALPIGLAMSARGAHAKHRVAIVGPENLIVDPLNLASSNWSGYTASATLTSETLDDVDFFWLVANVGTGGAACTWHNSSSAVVTNGLTYTFEFYVKAKDSTYWCVDWFDGGDPTVAGLIADGAGASVNDIGASVTTTATTRTGVFRVAITKTLTSGTLTPCLCFSTDGGLFSPGSGGQGTYYAKPTLTLGAVTTLPLSIGASSGGGGASAWTPADLGATDRLRWEFMDAASLTQSSGTITAIANKGSIASADMTAGSTAPLFSDGVFDSSNGGYLVSGDIDVADVFSDMRTGLWYGIVTHASGYCMATNTTWGSKFNVEGPGKIDWPNDGPEHGQLSGWTSNMGSTPQILTIRATATGKTVYLNGAQVATTEGAGFDDSPFTGGVGPLVLASYSATSSLFGASCTFRGATGIIDDNTPETQRKVEGWLAWAMSEAGDGQFVTALPSDHPYKSAAPAT